MDTGFWAGLGLIVTSIVLFAIGMPRRGEVVRFLRDRDGRQAFGMMAIIGIFALGIIVTLSHLR